MKPEKPLKHLLRNKFALISISSVVFGILVFVWIQLFWIKRYSADLDSNISVRLKHYDMMTYFLDPNTTKTLTIYNNLTGAKQQTEFVSESWGLYFYVRESVDGKTLTVIDPWLGGNVYDYATLKRLNTDVDYLSEEGWGEGLPFLDTITRLGAPALHFNGERFVSERIASSR